MAKSLQELISSYRLGENITKTNLMFIYEQAKEAYYNGIPVIEDFEFDDIENKLKLTNNSYVGAKHNPSYTIQHPFIMGSLSKVQIHKKDGEINWSQYFDEVNKYICRNISNVPCIITPKFDGCSFEARCFGNLILNVSSRGDGEYGADYYKHLHKLIDPNVNALATQTTTEYIIRGEVLINKKVFAEKYSDFVNPRSFVSGILNRDYSEDAEFQSMLSDLSIVIYDIRIKDELNYTWKDTDWTRYKYPDAPKYHLDTVISTPKSLEDIYKVFDNYRDICTFALDGIVIKPTDIYRENNLTEHRPNDCVAIKFIPMLQETEVVKIEWNIKKFGNLIPTIWVKPVTMDGKVIQKCSGSNYMNLVNKKVSIGTKVIMSLAGDIIPFLYKVTDTSAFDLNNMDIPQDLNIYEDGVNLKVAQTEEEKTRMKFFNSAASLNIPNLGQATVESIWNYLNNSNTTVEEDDFFGISSSNKDMPTNILLVSADDIYFGAGAGKIGSNCKKAFEELIKNINLVEIIKSCNFKFCGKKVAEQCANYLLNESYSFEHLAKEGYEWCFDKSNDNMSELIKIISHFGKSFDDYKVVRTQEEIEFANSRIPVILTGDPVNYKSKADFMNQHPEYIMTGSWKDVKIVFTNSLESNTGKMKKAREKNIELRLY